MIFIFFSRILFKIPLNYNPLTRQTLHNLLAIYLMGDLLLQPQIGNVGQGQHFVFFSGSLYLLFTVVTLFSFFSKNRFRITS